jgi:copper(I)-binding protein
MRNLCLLALMSIAACAPAGPQLSAHDGWARETGQGGMTAAYLTVENNGGADQLIGVRARIGRATLHESSLQDGVARMRPLAPEEGLVVPSNGRLRLAPGGAHVMIDGLDRSLKPGDRFDLTLLFAKARPETVQIAVQAAAAGGPGQ